MSSGLKEKDNHERPEVENRPVSAHGPTPADGVRLTAAFTQIDDPDLRVALIKIAEALASARPGRPFN